MTIFIDYSACEGCGACAETYPRFFVMRDDKAWVMNFEEFSPDEHREVAYCCPYGAITIE
jgi:ferredoxin